MIHPFACWFTCLAGGVHCSVVCACEGVKEWQGHPKQWVVRQLRVAAALINLCAILVTNGTSLLRLTTGPWTRRLAA